MKIYAVWFRTDSGPKVDKYFVDQIRAIDHQNYLNAQPKYHPFHEWELEEIEVEE